MNKSMDYENLEKLSGARKKELLERLLSSLLDNLSEGEKKELLQKIVAGSGENPRVIDMVEH